MSEQRNSPRTRWCVGLVTLVALVVACGSSDVDDAASATSSTTVAPPDTPVEEVPATTSPAADYPRIVEHALGVTTIDERPERIVAVAAPSIAEDLSDPSSPVSVAEAPLIHLEEGYTPRFDWRRWCTAKNVELPVGSAIVSNDYAIVVQAALDGQGVALGWNHIVAPLVENGRLVPVGGAAIETDAPFVILTRRGHDSEAIDRLTSWLTAAAG